MQPAEKVEREWKRRPQTLGSQGRLEHGHLLYRCQQLCRQTRLLKEGQHDVRITVDVKLSVVVQGRQMTAGEATLHSIITWQLPLGTLLTQGCPTMIYAPLVHNKMTPKMEVIYYGRVVLTLLSMLENFPWQCMAIYSSVCLRFFTLALMTTGAFSRNIDKSFQFQVDNRKPSSSFMQEPTEKPLKVDPVKLSDHDLFTLAWTCVPSTS